jgi:hypothetical protein
MPKILPRAKRAANRSLYDCLSHATVQLRPQLAPPPLPSLHDIDFSPPIPFHFDFTLEKLISVESIYTGISNSTSTTQLTRLQKLSDQRAHPSTLLLLPSTTSSPLTSILQQPKTTRVKRLSSASLPSPSDTLKILRRNSDKNILNRSSRKRPRQPSHYITPTYASTSSSCNAADPTDPTNSTDASRSNNNTLNTNNTDTTGALPKSAPFFKSFSSPYCKSAAVQNTTDNGTSINADVGDVIYGAATKTALTKRARTNKSPFINDTSLILTCETSTPTIPLRIKNDENKASPSNQSPLPTREYNSNLESVQTPRTPKELETELDDCKRQLLELRQMVTLLSQKRSPSLPTSIL